jgi:hypothetical protein
MPPSLILLPAHDKHDRAATSGSEIQPRTVERSGSDPPCFAAKAGSAEPPKVKF